MIGRRAFLLGSSAGIASFGLASRSAMALYFEDPSAKDAAALAAACREAGDDHAGLIATARNHLLRRIAAGWMPGGAREQVACPLCGCSVTVSADGLQ